MPYCPSCEAEYVKEVTECSDCRVELVDVLPLKVSYCPSCEAEYVEGVIECPDCHVELVDVLPLKWVPLRSVPGKPYAAMVTEVFDKEEIPNFVKSDAVSTAYLTSGTGIAVIYVPEEHLNRAEEILNQMLDHI